MSPFLRLCLFSCFTGPAWAAPTSFTRPTPTDDPVRLAPVIVTAAQTRDPLVIHVDPRAPAQPIPAHDGADALRSIPGFAVIRKGGTDGDPVLRGLAGSRLGVQIDGQTILGGCGNRMDPPTAYVFPSAYDRLVVIKGPQTVLHGPGNSAGVVLFERTSRRLANGRTDLLASLTAGSAGRVDVLADAFAGNPTWQARVTGTRASADDYDDGDGRPVHSRYRRWSTNAAVAWTPDEGTLVEVSAARSDGEAAYADRAMDGVAFDRDNLALRLRRERPGALVSAIEARAFHNYVDHVMDNFSLRTFTPSGMMAAPAVSNPDRQTRGALVQIDLEPRPATRITTGLETQANVHTLRTTSDQRTTPYASRPRVRDARFAQQGLFAEAATRPSERGRLFAGIRLDRWEVTDHRATVTVGMGPQPNPSAGRTRRSDLASGFVRYEHDLGGSNSILFAGLGRVQRFPDYWEILRNESTTSLSAFGTEPETTTQLDAGWMWRTDTLELNIAGFAAHIEDFILIQGRFAKPAAMGTTRLTTITRNIDATTVGGETGLAWRPLPSWKVETALAWVRGQNEDDDLPLAQLPPLEARLALAWTRPSWTAGALVRAVARQNRVAPQQGNIVGQDLGPTPGFATVSLHASWAPRDDLRISAGIDNLFDRAFAEHLSRSGAMVSGFAQTTRVNEPGRIFWLKVDWQR